MAVSCARCGTQNPDGNRFCQSCGTPLAAVAQVPAVPVGATAASPFTHPPAPAGTSPGQLYAPAPAYGAPQPPPTGAYQNPYYQPGPGAPTPIVHRTPWMLIIAVIVATVVVLSGVGTVLAFALNRHTDTQAGAFSSLSSPSPASTPTPGQTSPSPTANAGAQTLSTNTVSVVAPAGWAVLNKDATSISLQSPTGDGTIAIASGQSSPPETAQQLKSDIDKALGQKYPDVAECAGTSVTTGALAGAKGIFWELCFTATTGGQSVPIAEPLFVGANASGSVGYVVVLQTTQDNLDAFVKECLPILRSGIAWKLT